MQRLFQAFLLLMIALQPCSLRADETGWPRSVTHQAGQLTIERQPRRIASTSPSLTGILLAMDAPIIASAATTKSRLTDEKGFFTQWAALADERHVEVLYPNLKFDIEAIIGLNPDLLIVSSTGADSVIQHLDELKAQGIATLVVSYANQSWQDTASELGRALGLETQAAQAIARFDADVAAAAKSIAASGTPATIVGYNIGGSYSVARAESAQAQLLHALGFEVKGLPDTLRSQITRKSDFEFISKENLPGAVSTDTVFLLSASDRDVPAFLDDPLLANSPAVKAGRVYPLGTTSFRLDPYSGRQMIEEVKSKFVAR